MHLIMHEDKANIQQAEAIRFCKTLNTSPALAPCDTTAASASKTLLNYSGAFDLEYEVHLADTRMK